MDQGIQKQYFLVPFKLELTAFPSEGEGSNRQMKASSTVTVSSRKAFLIPVNLVRYDAIKLCKLNLFFHTD